MGVPRVKGKVLRTGSSALDFREQRQGTISQEDGTESGREQTPDSCEPGLKLLPSGLLCCMSLGRYSRGVSERGSVAAFSLCCLPLCDLDKDTLLDLSFLSWDRRLTLPTLENFLKNQRLLR